MKASTDQVLKQSRVQRLEQTPTSELPRPSRNARGESPCAACPVRDMNVCGALTDTDLATMNAISTDKTFERDQTLIWEGEAAGEFFIVSEGVAKVFKLLPDGRRQITGFLYPSDIVGLASNERYAYTAQALTPMRVCRFPRSKVLELFDEMPVLCRKVCCVASNELAAAQDQMVLLGRKNAAERLASFLLLLLRRKHLRGEEGQAIDTPMTRAEIADHLGLTTETVSRTVTQFRKLGHIELDGPHHILVRDEPALADLAAFDDPDGLPHTASF